MSDSQIEYVDTATRSDPVNVEAIAATNPDLIVAERGQLLTEEVVTEADEDIAATAAEHQEFEGKTITMAYDYGTEYGVEYYTAEGSFAESIMLDLGFAPNPLVGNFSEDTTVSDENQGQLDADVLLMIYADEETREAREADRLFQSIPAVSEGRYVPLTYSKDADNVVSAGGTGMPNAVWVTRAGASPLSLPWAVDMIADQWLAELDLS